jgi:Zn-dependent protease/predicted transcriptional regulator
MKSSWRIGRIAGIDVHLHFTFLLLLGWVAVSHYLQRQSWSDALGGLGFILSLFTIVVLHELGHALTARRFGIRTRDITLLPIGGVARLERIPEKPKQELLVALAGPAVNVVLAVLLFSVLIVGAELAEAKEFKLVGGNFLAKLMWVNVSLAVFNLLPAFPMDGGRVLRAVLAMRMDYVRATNVAASIGQGMAWVFGFIGLFTNPFLMFIALFVWIGAAQEASQAQMKSALAGLPVSRVMMTDFRVLEPGDTLARAVEHILAGCQQDFPVVDGGRVVGVLTRGDLLTGLAKQGQLASVAGVMQRNVCTAEAGEMVESVLARLQEDDCRVLPVTRDGELIGVLTTENLGEYILIQTALGETARGQRTSRRPAASPRQTWAS